ncbi:uncharacterized protein [Equus caballus]|uniref:uncharacterized protein n=1 Tax=Equus caballus TaxID=9796 RepID=UPI0038B394F3
MKFNVEADGNQPHPHVSTQAEKFNHLIQMANPLFLPPGYTHTVTGWMLPAPINLRISSSHLKMLSKSYGPVLVVC